MVKIREDKGICGKARELRELQRGLQREFAVRQDQGRQENLRQGKGHKGHTGHKRRYFRALRTEISQALGSSGIARSLSAAELLGRQHSAKPLSCRAIGVAAWCEAFY